MSKLDKMSSAIKRSLPTEAELAAMQERRLDDARNNPTCFIHWYPTLQKIGIRTPETLVLSISDDLQFAMCGDPAKDGVAEESESMRQQIEAFAEKVGYPLFIKNSLYSGKHSWERTCFVAGPEEKVMHHVGRVTEDWMCVGHDTALYIVVRKFIETEPAFYAFYGKMPVTKERRYFIQRGEVVAHHPYWPPHSVESPSVDNWRPLLDELNREPDAEIAYLTEQSKLISDALPGAWSVDWLQDKHGDWFCIDMAELRKSFVWNEYLEQTGQMEAFSAACNINNNR